MSEKSIEFSKYMEDCSLLFHECFSAHSKKVNIDVLSSSHQLSDFECWTVEVGLWDVA